MGEGGGGVCLGLAREEVGFVGDVGCGALREAEGLPFPHVDCIGYLLAERGELIGAGGSDGGGGESAEGGGLVECGWGGEEVQCEAGEGLRMDIEAERGGRNGSVFCGGAEGVEDFSEGELESAGCV